MKVLTFLFVATFCCQLGHAAKNTEVLKNKVSLLIGQSLSTNTDAQVLEVGMHNPKGQDFIYIPYVGLFLQNMDIQLSDMDSSVTEGAVNGSAIGIRVGVALPTRIFDLQLSFFSSLAFAQATVQDDPWFGKPEDAIDDQSMHQASLGVRVTTSKFILSYDFTFSDVTYLKNAHFIQLGVFF